MARSAKSRQAKADRHHESGGGIRARFKIEDNEIEHGVASTPDHFYRLPISGAKFKEVYKTKLGDLSPASLPTLEDTGRILITVPTPLALSPNHPAYYGTRFDEFLTPRLAAQLVRLWDALLKSGVKIPKPEKNRSSTSALHIGVWEIYMSLPKVSTDSRKQRTPAIRAMDKLLRFLKHHVVSKMKSLMQEFYPIQYERQQRAYARVQAELQEALIMRPDLDFEGAFFNIAMKEGGSEILHVDFNDEEDTPAWLLVVGDFEGGALSMPQLGANIPIRPGQIFATLTRNLAHCSTPIKGRRIVLTFFTDKFLLKHSDNFL